MTQNLRKVLNKPFSYGGLDFLFEHICFFSIFRILVDAGFGFFFKCYMVHIGKRENIEALEKSFWPDSLKNPNTLHG